MSNLVKYAESELKKAGFFDEDSDYGGMLGDSVLKMVQEFSNEGHSGFSAAMAMRLFQRVAMYKPLSPLTGEDDEWLLVADNEFDEGIDVYQNRRYATVFKRVHSDSGHLVEVYDLDGRVKLYPDGTTTVSRSSALPIEFPYMPKDEPIYMKVDDEGNPV